MRSMQVHKGRPWEKGEKKMGARSREGELREG